MSFLEEGINNSGSARLCRSVPQTLPWDRREERREEALSLSRVKLRWAVGFSQKRNHKPKQRKGCPLESRCLSEEQNGEVFPKGEKPSCEEPWAQGICRSTF